MRRLLQVPDSQHFLQNRSKGKGGKNTSFDQSRNVSVKIDSLAAVLLDFVQLFGKACQATPLPGHPTSQASLPYASAGRRFSESWGSARSHHRVAVGPSDTSLVCQVTLDGSHAREAVAQLSLKKKIAGKIL